MSILFRKQTSERSAPFYANVILTLLCVALSLIERKLDPVNSSKLPFWLEKSRETLGWKLKSVLIRNSKLVDEIGWLLQKVNTSYFEYLRYKANKILLSKKKSCALTGNLCLIELYSRMHGLQVILNLGLHLIRSCFH